MKYAAIGPIASFLPERVETNEDLQREFPSWNMEAIEAKTGIRERHIAAPNQCASDLGVAAAERLFEQYAVDPASIDYLLFCTQTPDYPLPTTACLLQERLGLPRTAGALDFNLGCSGFVYGLALADGLIRTGSVRRVLLVTAETYSKYIDRTDRSLRTIFGDGAAATLVEASPEPTLHGYRYGTDGAGADTLLVRGKGMRPSCDAIRPRGRQRWPSALYMDGPSLIAFALEAIPKLIRETLEAAGCRREDIRHFILHQATLKMMEALRAAARIPDAAFPIVLEDVGNTVSSTIPIVIERMRKEGRLEAGQRNMLVGFGVGLSWAACVWDECWSECEKRFVGAPS